MTREATLAQDDSPTREAPLEPAPSEAPAPRDRHWWGETALEIDQVARVVAGPLTLWARRREREWVLSTRTGPDGHAGEAERGHVVDEEDVPEEADVLRFSFGRAPTALLLKPLLADRPVVVRPDSALAIPSGERVTLFVSTPVWVSVTVGRASAPARRRRGGARAPANRRDDAVEDVLLTELATYRLSDTWFGPSTLQGELCYSSRTAGRLTLEELPMRPHRAVTPVVLDNRAPTPLVVQRILVPIPTLALYGDSDGALWTPTVILTRESDTDQASSRVDSQPPSVGRGAATRISDPRVIAPPGGVVRAFSRLFRTNEASAS